MCFLVSEGKKARLLKLFEGWCDNVMDLLLATDEEAILRRDIYDRSPILSWGKGRVTLLGDSVHAMQPNLGQGGCMAIEVKHAFPFLQEPPKLEYILKFYLKNKCLSIVSISDHPSIFSICFNLMMNDSRTDINLHSSLKRLQGKVSSQEAQST